MNRRERQRRRKGKKTNHPVRRVFLIVAGLSVVGVLVAAGCFAAWVAAAASDVPPLSSLHPRVPGQVSEVYAGNGQLMGYMSSDVVRIALPQDEQPSLMRKATVAIEDRRFWKHGAVDYEGMIRAAVKDVFEGGGIQGGSTLTMQLVNNTYTYLQNLRSSRGLKYKIAQAKLATDLFKRHSRNWILTQYLNDVPYGTVNSRNAIGIGAASHMFFDKSIDKLDLAQYALLAGLPQEPSGYNPFEYPERAVARRREVLQAMERSHYITRAQEEQANTSSLQVVANNSLSKVRQPYVFNYVQDQLKKDLGQRVLDEGGLKVYTTINLRDQAYAKQAIETNEGEGDDPASSLVSINPSNGHILALQNSTKYGDGPGETDFNYATQAQRQTGSVFKAFVLMTLIHDDDGDPNSTYYSSAPLPAGWLPGYPTYAVNNAEPTDSTGDINVTSATTNSVNAVFAQLGVDVGMTNVTKMANDMGLNDPKLASNPAEAIGGLNVGVSSLQVADAYATIADYGEHRPATIISKVVLPSGKVLHFGNPKPTRVFSEGQAYAATQVLQTVIQSGTGIPADYGCPAAGKTGTTSNYTDAWFAGYNPKVTTAVWVGYPNADTYMEDVNGLGPGYGGTLAAPIWRDYMQRATAGYCENFPPPSSYWEGKPYFGAHAVSPPVPKKGKKSKTSTTTTSTSTTTTTTTTTPPTTSTTTPATTTTNPTGGPPASNPQPPSGGGGV